MSEIGVALRELVRDRAHGYCEYCRISERITLTEHQIDHVIAMKHGGKTIAENLALCCTVCNRFKGSDIAAIDPDTGRLTPLFHPRYDFWEEHYELRDGKILAFSPKGRATAGLLRLNRAARIKERKLSRR